MDRKRPVSRMQPVTLPKPANWRGKSVHAALEARRTVRSISDKPFSLQMLSNLLWAACGINRSRGPFGLPGSTAASASNAREIDVYVALESGVHLYEPQKHVLAPVAAGDLRSMAIGRGQKTWGANAPVRLIYVVDIERFSKAGYQEPGLYDAETQKAYYFVDTGLIAGNVYLFAASQGLAAWFHNCDRAAIAKRLKLPPTKRALFGQTVGYVERSVARLPSAAPDKGTRLGTSCRRPRPLLPSRRQDPGCHRC